MNTYNSTHTYSLSMPIDIFINQHIFFWIFYIFCGSMMRV